MPDAITSISSSYSSSFLYPGAGNGTSRVSEQGGAAGAKPATDAKPATATKLVTDAAQTADKPDSLKSKLRQAIEQLDIGRLQQRDRQVRAHEQAHIGASGGLAQGGPSFVYQRGPDGLNYVVGGEVTIDLSPGRSPEETITKADLVRAAALAPGDPSPADLSIAARATQMELQARFEQAQKRAETTATSRKLNGDDSRVINAYSSNSTYTGPTFDLQA